MTESNWSKIWAKIKKSWHFIWNDDSVLGWFLNIIVAFILIKFIVYPGLGFILSTSYPVVAVVSGSMEHDGSFDNWWESPAYCSGVPCTQKDHYAQLNITKEDFLTFNFKNGFNTGDIIILQGKDPHELEKGNVIVFMGGKPDPVIHRIVNTWEENEIQYYQTKGDHNPQSISVGPLNELKTPEQAILGKAVFRIPYLGWIKIGAANLFGFLS